MELTLGTNLSSSSQIGRVRKRQRLLGAFIQTKWKQIQTTVYLLDIPYNKLFISLGSGVEGATQQHSTELEVGRRKEEQTCIEIFLCGKLQGTLYLQRLTVITLNGLEVNTEYMRVKSGLFFSADNGNKWQ